MNGKPHMRSLSFASRLIPLAALAIAACSADTTMAPVRTLKPSFAAGTGCTFPVLTGGILQPINADGSSNFQLTRTIPVKIRATDCASGGAVNTLAPMITLTMIDVGGGAVNEVVSSSAADDGVTMRSAGDGQYIFNLSTKRSQFNAGQDLVAGRYELRISEPSFAEVVVQFSIRQ